MIENPGRDFSPTMRVLAGAGKGCTSCARATIAPRRASCPPLLWPAISHSPLDGSCRYHIGTHREKVLKLKDLVRRVVGAEGQEPTREQPIELEAFELCVEIPQKDTFQDVHLVELEHHARNPLLTQHSFRSQQCAVLLAFKIEFQQVEPFDSL